jgi:hypothetical protein
MAARRVTTVTVPVDARSVVAYESYRDRTPLLSIPATRPGVAGPAQGSHVHPQPVP